MFDVDDVQPFRLECREYVRLVLEAALAQHLDGRVVVLRRPGPTQRRCTVQQRELWAGEEAREVGGGEDQAVVCGVHACPPARNRERRLLADGGSIRKWCDSGRGHHLPSTTVGSTPRCSSTSRSCVAMMTWRCCAMRVSSSHVCAARSGSRKANGSSTSSGGSMPFAARKSAAATRMASAAACCSP